MIFLCRYEPNFLRTNFWVLMDLSTALRRAQAEQLSGDKAGAERQFRELKQALASQVCSHPHMRYNGKFAWRALCALKKLRAFSSEREFEDLACRFLSCRLRNGIV
jgi:hypothetical protein